MRMRHVVTAVALAVAVAIGSTVVPSAAVPAKDIQQVEAELRDLEMRAAAATDEYNAARRKWDEAQHSLAAARAKVAEQRDALAATRESIDSLAAGLYMTGGLDTSLQVLLADNPADFLTQSSALDLLAQSRAAKLRHNQTARVRLAQSESTLADQEAIAQRTSSDMAAAKKAADARVADTQKLLASLQEAERQRLAALAAARKARSEAAARAAEAAVRRQASSSSVSPDLVDSAVAGAGSSRTRAAISYALSQVGKPYSFSASPPNSWDCSKLTAAAWGVAGVGLTPLSYNQWDQTRRIPVSQIQPGDLVFYFKYGAHHVAMYIGNGQMVSASNPSDGVEVTPFLGPWYGSRFSGVGRVVG